MKVFVTKYALTGGILEIQNAEAGTTSENMVYWKGEGGYLQFAHGHDWHFTETDAVDRAESMRVAKIASLRKSIAKLEKLTFGVKS